MATKTDVIIVSGKDTALIGMVKEAIKFNDNNNNNNANL